MLQFSEQANKIRQELEDKYEEMEHKLLDKGRCGGNSSNSTSLPTVEEMVDSLINMRNSKDEEMICNGDEKVEDENISSECNDHNEMETFLRKIKNNKSETDRDGMFGELTDDEKFHKNEEFLHTVTMTEGEITSDDRTITAHLLGENEAALASITDVPDENDNDKNKSGLKQALKMYIMGPARLFMSVEHLKHECRYARAIHRRLKIKNPSSAGEDSDANSKNNVCEVERIPHCDLVSIYAAVDTELLVSAPYKHGRYWYNIEGEKISEEEKEAWYTQLITHIQENTSCIQTHLAFRGRKKFKRGSRV